MPVPIYMHSSNNDLKQKKNENYSDLSKFSEHSLNSNHCIECIKSICFDLIERCLCKNVLRADKSALKSLFSSGCFMVASKILASL